MRKKLEQLRDDTQADSLAEVIRRSLAVYEFLWNETKKGRQLVVRAPDEGTEKEMVLL